MECILECQVDGLPVEDNALPNGPSTMNVEDTPLCGRDSTFSGRCGICGEVTEIHEAVVTSSRIGIGDDISICCSYPTDLGHESIEGVGGTCEWFH